MTRPLRNRGDTRDHWPIQLEQVRPQSRGRAFVTWESIHVKVELVEAEIGAQDEDPVAAP